MERERGREGGEEVVICSVVSTTWCQAEIWDLTESGVARCSSGNAIQPP